MSSLVVVRLDEPRGAFAWALAEGELGQKYNATPLTAAGERTPPRVLSGVPSSLPAGAPCWLEHPTAGALRATTRGEVSGGLRSALTELGEQSAGLQALRPVAAPGFSPGAAGPALLAARAGLGRGRPSPGRAAVRWAALAYRSAWEREGLEGAGWLDVVPLAHQWAVAAEVLGAPSVRFVLADEVGLGKTVEALMVWSYLSAATPGLRCAIAAPRSLVAQWSLEVRRRAEHELLASRLMDLPTVYVPGEGPLLGRDLPRGVVIAEHGALPSLFGEGVPFDMVIVDEAHALNSDQRAAVESLAKSAPHLLLLTATPRESRRGGGVAPEFRRAFAWALSLVDPKWPRADAEESSAAELERETERSLRRMRSFDAALARGEAPAAEDEEGAPATREGEPPRRALAASTLLERVVRTRRASIPEGLVARRALERVPVELREEEVAVLRAVREMDPADRAAVARQACSSWDALAALRGGRSEELTKALAALRSAGEGARPDAKAEALLDLCARLWRADPEAKVVIRCEYAETLDLVSERLRRALLRGGLRATSADELASWSAPNVGPVSVLRQSQDAMVDALRNPKAADTSMLAQLFAFERRGPGSAVALVANDVASTGLNLQFASALVLYDVPWTPGLAEQWIGRLDRIGQRDAKVAVYAMSHPAYLTERLLDVYERVGLFGARGFRVPPEVERGITALLRPAEAEEDSWEEAITRVVALLEEAREEGDGGAALDLPLPSAPTNEAILAAAQPLFRALEGAGLRAEPRDRWALELEWGERGDALCLPKAAAALGRTDAHRAGATPESIAAAGETRRKLRVSERWLDGARWLRPGSVDLLSPRHPLVAELEAETLRDPALPLAGMTCKAADAGLPPSVYVAAQRRNYPGLGGRLLASLCAAPDASEVDFARSLWRTTADALERMMRVRCASWIEEAAWRLSAGGAAPTKLNGDEVERVLAATRRASGQPAAHLFPGVAAFLESLERPPEAPPDAVAEESRRVAEEMARYLRLTLERRVAACARQLESVGSGDAWSGVRASRARELDAARALLERAGTLPARWLECALEAETPRVVSALVLEVTP